MSLNLGDYLYKSIDGGQTIPIQKQCPRKDNQKIPSQEDLLFTKMVPTLDHPRSNP